MVREAVMGESRAGMAGREGKVSSKTSGNRGKGDRASVKHWAGEEENHTSSMRKTNAVPGRGAIVTGRTGTEGGQGVAERKGKRKGRSAGRRAGQCSRKGRAGQ